METYISMLRGINVGKKKVLMADLKALYENLKLKDIRTYIQSGNVVFKSNSQIADKDLAKKIEHAIFEKYNFPVPVVIRRLGELEELVKINPFLKNKKINTEKLHITFLGDAPAKENIESLTDISFLPDSFFINANHVFVHCPEGYGETKLSNTFFEKKLKVCATTRNWKTVNKLIELA